MIASLVVTLKPNCDQLDYTICQLGKHSNIEVGELVKGYRLPVTIESNDAGQLDQITQWIQNLISVAGVDVIYIHFDDSIPSKTDEVYQRVGRGET